MKSVVRFSTWVAFAALFCFASSAFGQGNMKLANSGNSVLNYAPSGLFVLALGPAGDHGVVVNRSGSGNGCGSQGWNDRGWGGNGGGRCTQVPEGGTALMYLFLAGLCCTGAMFLRQQRNPEHERATE